jgi:hypothetical protein
MPASIAGVRTKPAKMTVREMLKCKQTGTVWAV